MTRETECMIAAVTLAPSERAARAAAEADAGKGSACAVCYDHMDLILLLYRLAAACPTATPSSDSSFPLEDAIARLCREYAAMEEPPPAPPHPKSVIGSKLKALITAVKKHEEMREAGRPKA